MVQNKSISEKSHPKFGKKKKTRQWVSTECTHVFFECLYTTSLGNSSRRPSPPTILGFPFLRLPKAGSLSQAGLLLVLKGGDLEGQRPEISKNKQNIYLKKKKKHNKKKTKKMLVSRHSQPISTFFEWCLLWKSHCVCGFWTVFLHIGVTCMPFKMEKLTYHDISHYLNPKLRSLMRHCSFCHRLAAISAKCGCAVLAVEGRGRA